MLATRRSGKKGRVDQSFAAILLPWSGCKKVGEAAISTLKADFRRLHGVSWSSALDARRAVRTPESWAETFIAV
jgi:hypothetical protein